MSFWERFLFSTHERCMVNGDELCSISQGCSLGLETVSRRSFQTSRLGLVETWEGLGLDLVSDWKSNISVSSRSRAIGSRLQANIHSFLLHCKTARYIVLNASRLYCLLIHKLTSRLHPCCIYLQLQCSTHYSKVLKFSLTLLMQHLWLRYVFSERELTFTFAVCCRPSVHSIEKGAYSAFLCTMVRLSVVCL